MRHEDTGQHDGLAHLFDRRDCGQRRRAVDPHCLAVGEQHFVNHRWGRGDQRQVILALQAFLNDLHVQHAKETAAEAKTQSVGAFRLVVERCVVQRELFQRVAEILEIIRRHRKQPCIDLRLNLLESCQRRHVRRRGMGERIPYWRALDLLDARNNEAYFAGAQDISLVTLRGKHSYAIHEMGLADGLGNDLVALAQRALLYTHQRHHAKVVVEPGIDDQGLQRGIDIALRRRHETHQLFQDVDDAHACLGAGAHRIGGVDADDFLDLLAHLLGLCLRQVHLVEHGNHFKTLLDGGVAGRHGLRFDALACIYNKQRAFAGGE